MTLLYKSLEYNPAVGNGRGTPSLAKGNMVGSPLPLERFDLCKFHIKAISIEDQAFVTSHQSIQM